MTAGQTQTITISVTPNTTTISGFYRFSTFQTLFQQLTGATPISLTARGADINTPVTGTVNADGTWTVTNVPVSTNSITRSMNLIFSHPDIQTFTLTNVVVPNNQTTSTITNPVILQPLTIDV